MIAPTSHYGCGVTTCVACHGDREYQAAQLRRPVTTAEEAEDRAIQWSHWIGGVDLSMGEMAEWVAFFEELADRYGLGEVFTENGII